MNATTIDFTLTAKLSSIGSAWVAVSAPHDGLRGDDNRRRRSRHAARAHFSELSRRAFDQDAGPTQSPRHTRRCDGQASKCAPWHDVNMAMEDTPRPPLFVCSGESLLSWRIKARPSLCTLSSTCATSRKTLQPRAGTAPAGGLAPRQASNTRRRSVSFPTSCRSRLR